MPIEFAWSLITPPAPAAAPVGSAAAASAIINRDLQLDLTTRRLVMAGGSFVFTTGAYSILQDVWLALGFFEGEWFLDLDAGVPYFRKVLVKSPNMDDIRATYRDKILSRPGVKELLALELNFDRRQRALAVSFRLNTDAGELASSSAFMVGS